MSLRLDHIVIAVHDLERARADYTALGFTVLEGGSHPGRATHNALVVFEDGVYFELIAWHEPVPQQRWWQHLQQHGEGIVDVALLPHDVASVVAQAGARGVPYQGPNDGGRLRPDGQRLQWQTAHPDRPDLPFLCGDISPRVLRVPDGAARIHANGATGVASLSIAVQDVPASLARWRALLGPQAVSTESTTLAGQGQRAAFIALGGSTLALLGPRVSAAAPSGDAQLQSLARRGEGPYALTLTTQDQARTGQVAPLAQTHGAWIEFDSLHSVRAAA
ncbi:MAG: VOC family protein [Comamonadaceae bacterium]|nr:MAG: VOC family protein [Comamonadaceae bacterium]